MLADARAFNAQRALLRDARSPRRTVRVWLGSLPACRRPPPSSASPRAAGLGVGLGWGHAPAELPRRPLPDPPHVHGQRVVESRRRDQLPPQEVRGGSSLPLGSSTHCSRTHSNGSVSARSGSLSCELGLNPSDRQSVCDRRSVYRSRREIRGRLIAEPPRRHPSCTRSDCRPHRWTVFPRTTEGKNAFSQQRHVPSPQVRRRGGGRRPCAGQSRAGCGTGDSLTPAAPIPPPQFRPGNTGDAFLLDKKGAFSTFAVPGDVIETMFSDLNNRGDTIGGYVRSDRTGQGFLLDDGVLTPIAPPGALATLPLHINAKGQIVGIYSDVSETYPIVVPLHGFLLSDGVYTTIDVPGSSSTVAFGINNRGQIVGASSMPMVAPWLSAGRRRLHHHRYRRLHGNHRHWDQRQGADCGRLH